jgi:hypothetical protein
VACLLLMAKNFLSNVVSQEAVGKVCIGTQPPANFVATTKKA